MSSPASNPEALFQRALQHAQAGQFADSERLLRSLLERFPAAVPARLTLARVLMQQQKTAAALQVARTCAQEHPRDANVGGVHAQLLQAAGQLKAAIAELRRVAALAPGHAGIKLHLATLLQLDGQAEAALALQDELLALAPDDAELWFNRALCLRDLGRKEAALAACARVLRQRPDDAECWAVQASLQHAVGQPEVARISAERALALAPEHPGALQVHGLALLKSSHPAAALSSLRRAAALQPDSAMAQSNLALGLVSTGAHEEALLALDAALKLDAGHPEIWFNHGVALLGMRRNAEAETSYRRVLALQADHVPAHLDLVLALHGQHQENKAIALCNRLLSPGALPLTSAQRASALIGRALAQMSLGQYQEAREDLDQALKNAPGRIEALWNLSHLDLLQGRLCEGWAGYDVRWRCADFEPARHTHLPALKNLDAIAGRRVLVWSEQGFGDTLQFCRYVPLLAALGAEVTLEAQAPLLPLLATLGGCRVLAVGADYGEVEAQIPLMSLPGLFGTTLATIPADTPYLQVDAARLAHWRARCPATADGRPKIGLAFAGNPLHSNDAQRSASLAACLPLAEVAQLHILQTGLSTDEQALLDAHPEIRFHGAALHDFADSAAAAACMDLILSVDTSLAHLAGALGLPVWLLLPQVPEWRWMIDREDSPWYPGMRLWRQQVAGDWDELIARVRAALADRGHDGPPSS